MIQNNKELTKDEEHKLLVQNLAYHLDERVRVLTALNDFASSTNENRKEWLINKLNRIDENIAKFTKLLKIPATDKLIFPLEDEARPAASFSVFSPPFGKDEV